MNVNANLMRLYGLIATCSLVAGLAACGGMAPLTVEDNEYAVENYDSDSDASPTASIEQSQRNSAGTRSTIAGVDTRILAQPTTDNFGLELVSSASYNRLVVLMNSNDVEYQVSRMTAPERLIIDLENNTQLTDEFFTPEANYMQSVRVGLHEDKSRLVIDIADNGDDIISHHVEEVDGNVVITLAKSEAIEAALIQKDYVETEQAEVSEPVVETPEVIADASSTSAPELKSLAFESSSATQNILIADMASAGFYTFEKTAPSEYVLTLEGAAMNPGQIKTMIAPKGSGKIRSVRPVAEGENVMLRIFAAPQTLLKVDAQGNRLVIAEYNDSTVFGANNDADMKAQADVEAASESIEDEGADSDALLSELLGDDQKYTGRLISLDLQDTDIDNALRIIAEVSNLNIIASDDVTGKVTLRLIDVPWDQALDVILKTNGLDKVQEGNVIRIAPVEKLRAERELLRQAQQAEEELEPLRVQYIRVSYARAAELAPLVETVITERGTVTFDERTNQLIVKDISKGLRNVARLVQKLDLRTPQVLIETQIVEAQRNFQRDLGSEFGFFYLRSPETGNATNVNFPNSINIGGTAIDTQGETATPQSPAASFFPSADPRSAVSFLFGSADGTKGLNFRLTQGEQEGRVRVISRPSVAVTNNSPAVIKSVEKIRIKLPSGGVSVATGQGASAAGSAAVATEIVEIGIVLNVTAQASPDYYVLLDLDAKSSTLGDINRGVDQIPPEIERSATSSVLISSGQTFAMGGIYRIEESDTVRGVPFLKDVPALGHLFRGTTVADGDEELIFFITPRIVEGSFDDAAMKGLSS